MQTPQEDQAYRPHISSYQRTGSREVVNVCKVASEDNLADPFTKTLTAKVFEGHVKGMGISNMQHLLL